MLKNNNIGVVVLAAGQGTRLGCTDKPKVMLEIGGKPIVSYIVETLERIGFLPEQIVLVVGFRKEVVEEYFGDRVTYAIQDHQIGTAHASFVGMSKLPAYAKKVLVIGGDDGAFYSADMLKTFIADKEDMTLAMLSAVVNNPGAFGRVLRGEAGQFLDVLEKEEVLEEQSKIHEVSTGTYFFDRFWFESVFPRVKKIPGLGEYGLNKAVAMAHAEGKKMSATVLENRYEWFGINTKEELVEADRRKG